MGDVEVDHGLTVDAHVVFVDDLEDFAGGDVAGGRGCRTWGNAPRGSTQRSPSGMDWAARLSLRSLGTQTRPPSPRADSDMRRSLSSPGMAVGWTWMNSPLRSTRPAGRERLRAAGADDGVCGFAEDGSVAAGADDDGVCGERPGVHGAEIHGGDTAAGAFGVEDGGEELPAFVLGDFAFCFVAADLLVEGVEKLLAVVAPANAVRW